MINSYSRYANSKVEMLYDAINRAQPRPTIIPNPPRPRAFNYTEYQIIADDRIDELAYQLLGDANLWWIIADANPEILLWIDLVPGTIIRVPSV